MDEFSSVHAWSADCVLQAKATAAGAACVPSFCWDKKRGFEFIWYSLGCFVSKPLP